MQSSNQNRFILHIDDDPDDRQLIKEAISEHDNRIAVHEVENGKTAFHYLNRAKKYGSLPSLIILDLNMPVMNGKEFLTELKKDSELSNIPVIIFTTSSAPCDKEFAKKHGVEFLTKPPSINQLFDAVKKILYLFSVGCFLIRMDLMMQIRIR